jgi:hypothetical protein
MRQFVTIRFSVRFLLMFAMAGAWGLMAQATLASSPVDWSEPELLRDQDGRNWFPEVDADIAGNVRIIWEQSGDPDDEVQTDANSSAFMLAQDTAEPWVNAGDIYVKDVYNAGRPIIHSDDTYLHLLGRALRGSGIFTTDSIQGLGGVYYMRAPLDSDVRNAQSWSKPVPISNSSAYWASMITLTDGALVVVYNEQRDILVDGEIITRSVLMSRRSTDHGETWEHPVRISYTGEPAARSSMAVTEQGRSIVVSWDEGYDNLTGYRGSTAIFTAVSTDGGVSWQDHARIGDRDQLDEERRSVDTRRQVEQSVLESNGGTTVLVYRSTARDVLLYRLSDDGGRTWSPEFLIPDAIPRPYAGPHHFDKLGLAVDGDGRFLLAYAGYDPEDPTEISVMMTTFNGKEWSSPEVIGEHDGYPEYPRVAVSLGNQVYVTYFVRDELHDDNTPQSVWVVRGVTNAQPVDPVPVHQASIPSVAGVDEQGRSPEMSSPIQLYPYPDRPSPPESIDGLVSSNTEPRTALHDPLRTSMALTVVALCVAALGVLGARSVFRSLI